MRRKLIMALCLGLCTSGSIKLALAEDMTVNRLLASQCAQCHGTNGHAVGDMDGLSDESYKDLYEDLMDMRSEDRPEDIMDHQALGYTNDKIRRIAAYYGMRSGKGGEQPEGVDESEEQKGGNDSEHQEEGLMQEREKRQKENQRERKKSNREKDDD